MIVYLLGGYYTHMHVHMCVNIYVIYIYIYCILLYYDIIVSYHTISHIINYIRSYYTYTGLYIYHVPSGKLT